METIIDQISLPKFKVNRWKKFGSISGLILCRDLTFEEAYYIFENILMFNGGELEEEIDNPEELDEWKEDLINNITSFINGDINMNNLLNEYAPECIDDGDNIWDVIDIIQYLVSINAIEYEKAK